MLPHITVCICTYKRLRFLERLLEGLGRQQTKGEFTYSILVADNDRLESARPLVQQFATRLQIPIKYCVETEQNIALTRNRAVANAEGDYVSFIDDDEFPTDEWLHTLFKAIHQFKVDGSLGPVMPHYEEAPPSWVIRGKFHERPSYPTGFIIDWKKGRTGNCLLKKELFDSEKQPFNPDFLTGEDKDFFRRMIQKGYAFVWCEEAVAYETVPAIRWNRKFMLKRALLRGKISLKHASSGGKDVLKSIIAMPAYALALPILLVIGQHAFMKYLVKAFDHAGRIMAFVGLDPVKEKYVTE